MPFIVKLENHGDTTLNYIHFSSLPPEERRKEAEKVRQKERKRALVARLKEIARG